MFLRDGFHRRWLSESAYRVDLKLILIKICFKNVKQDREIS